MMFHSHQPVFPLDHFIENLIYFDGLSAAHNLDRFLPDGNTEIIIDLTEQPGTLELKTGIVCLKLLHIQFEFPSKNHALLQEERL